MCQIKSSALYLQKLIEMETTKKRTGLYWILFILSVVLFFVILFSPWGSWVSMMLPFNCTLLAMALDLM